MIRECREVFVVELYPGTYWKDTPLPGLNCVGFALLATQVEVGSAAFKLEPFPRDVFPNVRLVKVRLSVDEAPPLAERYANLLLDWTMKAIIRCDMTADEELRSAAEIKACLEEAKTQSIVLTSHGRRPVLQLFLDDLRSTPEGWACAKTAPGAILLLQHCEVPHLSLDHDLGEGYGTGYDVMCWLEDAVVNHGYPMPTVTIHSANPVGRANIQRVIDSIHRYLESSASFL